jgi:hypothetical protein
MYMRPFVLLIFLLGNIGVLLAQDSIDTAHPVTRTERIDPIHKSSFTNNGQCPERKQGGNATTGRGILFFNGEMEGNRQVDPQIAVGGGYVLHGTNKGLLIYNKKGEFIQGVSQKCFNDGIDPKLFFDIHNRIFVFDLWWYYDKAKTKPANIAVSASDNPTGAWNIYPVSLPKAKDGGSIGYGKKWIGYSFPGGSDRTFVLKTSEAKSGNAAKVYHFKGTLGHPVLMQDDKDDLYFFELDDQFFYIRKVVENMDGQPVCILVSKRPHQLNHIQRPPQSPQKGTEQKVASGDRNPKVVVYQNGCIWFSQCINYNGRSAVQWHQINAETGEILQSGLIAHPSKSYIQTTLTVNKQEDVLIGFQQTDTASFISSAYTYRKKNDKAGTVRSITGFAEGKGATIGASWGDYSGSIIDGDNLADLWTVQSVANEKGRGETVILRKSFNRKPKK